MVNDKKVRHLKYLFESLVLTLYNNCLIYELV